MALIKRITPKQRADINKQDIISYLEEKINKPKIAKLTEIINILKNPNVQVPKQNPVPKVKRFFEVLANCLPETKKRANRHPSYSSGQSNKKK
jgi:hypothetical protein